MCLKVLINDFIHVHCFLCKGNDLTYKNNILYIINCILTQFMIKKTVVFGVLCPSIQSIIYDHIHYLLLLEKLINIYLYIYKSSQPQILEGFHHFFACFLCDYL